MGTCPDAIKKLVDRFTEQTDEIRSPDYKEHLIRVDFLDPFSTEGPALFLSGSAG